MSSGDQKSASKQNFYHEGHEGFHKELKEKYNLIGK